MGFNSGFKGLRSRLISGNTNKAMLHREVRFVLVNNRVLCVR